MKQLPGQGPRIESQRVLTTAKQYIVTKHRMCYTKYPAYIPVENVCGAILTRQFFPREQGSEGTSCP